MADFRIDPRIRDIFPPLTDEEFANLEREILDDGKINEPLVIYKGVLIDGHHRYRIAQKHSIPYETIEKDFADWGDALGWARRHQKARRNLNKTQDALIVADIEELVASIRAKAMEKKADAVEKAREQRWSKETECESLFFLTSGKTERGDSAQKSQPLTIPSPQADVPIQAVNMPRPTVKEQARQNQAMPPEPQAQPLRQTASKQPSTATQTQETPRPAPNPKAPQIHTNKELAKIANVGHDTMDKVMAVKDHGDSELLEKMRTGKMSANKAYQTIRREKKAEEVKKAQSYIESQNGEGSSTLYVDDSIGRTVECDLLLTDPPYSTDVPDIEEFVDQWLYAALDGVKSDGFAYVFIGAYPNELAAYLTAEIPDHLELEQVLVWTYKNTLGNNPKGRYKQNWQACLFYRGIDAPDLDCPLTNEQWAVQEVNAPDGRQGDRFHAWQKPLELCERFIRHTTKKGDTVYDPFACTGTTLVAAAKLGRNGIGYEINQDNAEIAFGRGVTHG